MWLFYVPVPDAEAEALARKLLEAGVCRCINLVPGRSLYVWKGRLESERETLLIAKTATPEKFERLARELHPYELPAIIKLKAEASEDYEKWLAD